MSSTLRNILESKTKSEIIDMYIDLAQGSDNTYFQLAMTDPLTDCLNRRGAEFKFESLQKTNLLNKYALVFIDLDHFKHINDDFGHDWGDRALSVIAQRLKEYFKNDSVVRFGGDEFFVITDKDEKFSRNFDNYCNNELVDYQDSYLSVRCSIGYAKYEKEISLHDWIVLADNDMYIDKHRKQHR